MNLTKKQWEKIVYDGDEDAYAQVMDEFTKDSKNPEVVQICDTFKVLEAVVQYTKEQWEIVKKELPEDAKFDEDNIIDICNILHLRLDMLLEDSLKD